MDHCGRAERGQRSTQGAAVANRARLHRGVPVMSCRQAKTSVTLAQNFPWSPQAHKRGRQHNEGGAPAWHSGGQWWEALLVRTPRRTVSTFVRHQQ
ncbi:hypothetical protein SKAU_G00256530 [Synaphobranchus kaupii]|uniref:Uncharacterized protein n=1 Tax=Synaphobranchus kaupii TaxID=118154 RepID=A0A9Q1F3W6_SYNKA|nr:hypothetical protein SKAU_G00256530 [Synaphobranchus kaupii]